MLSYIRGVLAEVENGIAVIENNGIGYEVNTSAESIVKFGPLGSEVTAYTKLIPKEDSINLYGFADKEEKNMFELLLTVSGIGPKGALAILSYMSVDDIKFAVVGEDSKTFARVPGVGKKTAERAIIDLKDKVGLMDAFESKLAKEKPAAKAANNTVNVRNEVMDALVALGYSATNAAKALDKMTITESTTTEQLLTDTLKQMSFI